MKCHDLNDHEIMAISSDYFNKIKYKQMKKYIISIAILCFFIITVLILTAHGYEDLNHCIVKYKSEWGKPCSNCNDYSKSYRVYFKNECYNRVDVKLAVQESDNRWKTYTRIGVGYNDTLSGYACKGTGKYRAWPKKTGDTSVEFPSDEEINQMK